MKSSIVALGFAALVAAQANQIPQCAIPALDKAIAANTDCDPHDYPCVCAHISDVQAAATAGVIAACGEDVAINQVLPAAEALCKNPPPFTGTTAAATTTPVATPTETPTETTPAATTPAVTETTVPATTPGTITVRPTNATAPAPPTGTPVVPGAGAAVAPMGGLAMLLVAALAL